MYDSDYGVVNIPPIRIILLRHLTLNLKDINHNISCLNNYITPFFIEMLQYDWL